MKKKIAIIIGIVLVLIIGIAGMRLFARGHVLKRLAKEMHAERIQMMRGGHAVEPGNQDLFGLVNNK